MFLVSWFPGCTAPEVLACLRAGGVAGIELRHVDEDAALIRDAGLVVSFHLPFLKDGTTPEINLTNERILTPYREGRMGGLALSPLPYIGFHFGYSALEVAKRHGPDVALTPTLSRAETSTRMARQVRELARLTGKTILLENVDYGPTGAVEYVCEPSFLRDCASAWGCGVLLDIAHALVSARPLGYAVAAYLEEMIAQTAPLIRSIHLNAPADGLDQHLPVTPEVISWLCRALDAGTCPATLILERANVEQEPPRRFAERLVAELAEVRAAVREAASKEQTR